MRRCAGDLDGDGIHAAHRDVEDYPADDVHLGHHRAHDRGALPGGNVVRFQDEAREALLTEAARQRDVVDDRGTTSGAT